jgi:hypothetical protein
MEENIGVVLSDQSDLSAKCSGFTKKEKLTDLQYLSHAIVHNRPLIQTLRGNNLDTVNLSHKGICALDLISLNPYFDRHAAG